MKTIDRCDWITVHGGGDIGVPGQVVESIGPEAKPAGGRKDDQGKPRWDLVPMSAVESVVSVFTMGAKKYRDRNWEKGIAWLRVFAAVMRHLCAWRKGEDLDQESGLPHLAHVAWGCLALLEYSRTKPEMDDRAGNKFLATSSG